jgi:hypothetical protein
MRELQGQLIGCEENEKPGVIVFEHGAFGGWDLSLFAKQVTSQLDL